MEGAIAGAMLLALPIMELLLGPGTQDALHEVTGIVAGALLVAAAAVFVHREC